MTLKKMHVRMRSEKMVPLDLKRIKSCPEIYIFSNFYLVEISL